MVRWIIHEDSLKWKIQERKQNHFERGQRFLLYNFEGKVKKKDVYAAQRGISNGTTL